MIARTAALLAAACLLWGCGDGDDSPVPPPLSQRARDSAIGASVLPGAQGVRGALRASDSAAARAARIAEAADSGG